MNPKVLSATTLFAAFAIVAGAQASHASTVAVDLATFNADLASTISPATMIAIANHELPRSITKSRTVACLVDSGT